MYEKATKPIVLIDACAIRYGVTGYARELIEKTGMTYFTSPMGKTAIDEQHPQFRGIYVGDITVPPVKEAVESADFTLYIGALKSDFNTGSFSYHIPAEDSVELHSDHTQIQVSWQFFERDFPADVNASFEVGKLSQRNAPSPHSTHSTPRRASTAFSPS